MNFYYKFNKGLDWVELSGNGSDPKICINVKFTCNKGNEDIKIIQDLEEEYHPVYKSVLNYKDNKNNLIIQVNKFGSLIKFGYRHHSNNFPKIEKIIKISKAEKTTISISKAEKTIKVKATHKRKAHKRVIHFEGKELEKKIKSPLDPDNLTEIKSLEDCGINIVGGIHEDETFICKFKGNESAIHKVMPLGDVAGETGTYKISKIIGWDVVPETIKCDYGKGVGSSQKWIDGDEPSSPFYNGVTLAEKHLNDLSKIFIMDMINGNFDRHDGNLIVDKNDHVWAIDNESIGKLNSAELNIESLEEYVKDGRGFSTPMMQILKNSFGNDVKMYQNFKDHIIKNFPMALNKKDEIIAHWSQYKDSDYLNTDVPIKNGIKSIEKNIEYLEKYIKR